MDCFRFLFPAYEVLSDPNKRKGYDLYGKDGPNQAEPSFDYKTFFGHGDGHFTFENMFKDMPFFDDDPMFSDFFGHHQHQPRKLTNKFWDFFFVSSELTVGQFRNMVFYCNFLFEI